MIQHLNRFHIKNGFKGSLVKWKVWQKWTPTLTCQQPAGAEQRVPLWRALSSPVCSLHALLYGLPTPAGIWNPIYQRLRSGLHEMMKMKHPAWYLARHEHWQPLRETRWCCSRTIPCHPPSPPLGLWIPRSSASILTRKWTPWRYRLILFIITTQHLKNVEWVSVERESKRNQEINCTRIYLPQLDTRFWVLPCSHSCFILFHLFAPFKLFHLSVT